LRGHIIFHPSHIIVIWERVKISFHNNYGRKQNIASVFLSFKIIFMYKYKKKHSVKYLGFYLDKMLTWVTHFKTKQKSLNLQLTKLKQLLESHILLKKQNSNL